MLDLKEAPEPTWAALTRDLEMTLADTLQAEPWQTEACIGNWHYDRRLLTDHAYRTPALMIPLFVDIVSKNGNLLLSIPLPGHGEPDGDEVAFLEEMAAWQAINGEAIKGTRPWTIFGEGPSTRTKDVPSYQLAQFAFDHRDIRFTTRNGLLYAVALGVPANGTIVIEALRRSSPHHPREIARVELLGGGAPLRWTRGERELAITLPPQVPSRHALAFRITPA